MDSPRIEQHLNSNNFELEAIFQAAANQKPQTDAVKVANVHGKGGTAP